MEALTANLHQYGVAYVILAVIFLPILWLTRRYTFPPIQWVIEWCVFSAVFHVIVHGVVAVARWFREESQMQAIKDQRITLDWQTPLTYFWKRELYRPIWIFYFELCVVIVFIVLMFRYRPMKRQKQLPKREGLTKGMARHVPASRGAIRPKQR